MTITAEDNKLVKRANKLKERKFRDESGEYLIEGLRGIVDTPKDLIKDVICVEGKFDDRLDGLNVSYVTQKIMDKLSLTQNSCGMIAIAAKKPSGDFVSDRILYLDRIRDPGNMGTIIRTAVAAGYEIVCDDCVDVYNPKVVRSCVSALSKAEIHVGNFIDILVKKGYNIIGASLDGENAFSGEKPKKFCIVLGNEANGIRPEIIAKCDLLRTIPMENMESLNVAICAAIFMYYYRFM